MCSAGEVNGGQQHSSSATAILDRLAIVLCLTIVETREPTKKKKAVQTVFKTNKD